jgi:hypothetical protein
VEELIIERTSPIHATTSVPTMNEHETKDHKFRQRWLSNHWYLKKDHVRGISDLEEYNDLQADFGPYLLRLEQNRAPIVSESLSDSQLPVSERHCLATSESHLSKLLESYMDTIHILHPILAQPRILFKIFNSHVGRLTKDKTIVLDNITTSVENAIVLLMLALGEVCAYGGLHPDTRIYETFEDDPRYDSRSNGVLTLPGVAYFSRAATMLAMMMGAYTIQHAQAMILAALFLNHFARPSESWAWISNACRIVDALLQEYEAVLLS